MGELWALCLQSTPQPLRHHVSVSIYIIVRSISLGLLDCGQTNHFYFVARTHLEAKQFSRVTATVKGEKHACTEESKKHNNMGLILCILQFLCKHSPRCGMWVHFDCWAESKCPDFIITLQTWGPNCWRLKSARSYFTSPEGVYLDSV